MATTRRRTPVREYSRAFDMTKTTRRAQIAIDVPPALHRSIRAKAKREGVSVRALVLSFLEQWADGDVARPTAAAVDNDNR